MDCGDRMLMLVGPNVSQDFLNQALGKSCVFRFLKTLINP